jgi:Histidine kinase-, DNA gyrase B-, and HSP90-like ATPase
VKEIAFNISARAAKLIGQENFANAEGAVIELVKNGYDADATACIIVFREIDSSLYIIDDGEGMTEKVITDYWMTIGTDHKNNNSATGGKSRIKTGAKGIGRFALDRLGVNCELVTNTEKTSPIEWKVSWTQFDGAGMNLSDVKATLEEQNGHDLRKYVTQVLDFVELPADFFEKHFTKNTGTAIKISSLRDQWDEGSVTQLFQNIEQLVPPLEVNTFGIYLYSERYPDMFGPVDPAPFVDFDYKLTANVGEDHKATIKICRKELDIKVLQSRGFFADNKLAGGNFSLAAFQKEEFEIQTSLEELLPGFKEVDREGQLDKIGAFDFTFYFLKRGGAAEKDEDDRTYPYRDVNYSVRSQLLSRYGGIKIFRDNFRIRPYGEVKSTAFDWLDLGVRATRNPTITRLGYSVRPNQVYGIVNVSRISNAAFQDKSNREGLQENDTFSLFKEVLVAIINKFETDRSQIMLAVKTHHEATNPEAIAKANASEEIKRYKREKAAKAKAAREQEARDKANGKAGATDNSDTKSSNQNTSQQEQIDDADKVIDQSEQAINALKQEIDELRQEQKLYRVLASTGLTVSSFAHELKNLSGILIPRSGYLKTVLEEFIKPEMLQSTPDYKNPYVMLNDIRADDERVSQWLDFSLSSLRKDKRKRSKIDLLMLRSHFGQHVMHGFESAQIKLGFEAKMANA